VGPGANQIVEISPSGQEIARAPDPAANSGMEVPFDSPSSVQFDGNRMIVTNDAYFSGDQTHMVIFDVWAGEPGEPVYVPGVTQPSPGVLGSKKLYSLSVSPRSMPPSEQRRYRFRAMVKDKAGRRPLARGVVLFAGHRAPTDARGVAFLRATLHRRGRHLARLLLPGSRATVAKAYVNVRRESSG
jgi:hypothetical protein